MIRVAIIHPQPIYLQGVKLVLNAHSDLKIAATASNMGELIQHYTDQDLDVIVWHLSGHHALVPGLRLIRDQYPIAKLLVLCDAQKGMYTGFLSNLGADAVIDYSATGNELHQSIVELSKKYAPPPSSNHVQDPMAHKMTFHGLTPREQQILQLVCEGISTPVIAHELKLSRRTVEGHRKRLRKKLKARNTAMLVRVAIEQNLIPLKINQ